MGQIAQAFQKAMGLPQHSTIPSVKNLHPDLRALDAEEDRGEDEFVEIINRHGFPELGFFENNRWFPVCSQCFSHMMENRGNGMCCDACQHQALMDADHDHL